MCRWEECVCVGHLFLQVLFNLDILTVDFSWKHQLLSNWQRAAGSRLVSSLQSNRFNTALFSLSSVSPEPPLHPPLHTLLKKTKINVSPSRWASQNVWTSLYRLLISFQNKCKATKTSSSPMRDSNPSMLPSRRLMKSPLQHSPHRCRLQQRCWRAAELGDFCNLHHSWAETRLDVDSQRVTLIRGAAGFAKHDCKSNLSESNIFRNIFSLLSQQENRISLTFVQQNWLHLGRVGW